MRFGGVLGCCNAVSPNAERIVLLTTLRRFNVYDAILHDFAVFSVCLLAQYADSVLIDGKILTGEAAFSVQQAFSLARWQDHCARHH